MKRDTTVIEEYPIDAPIILYLGIRNIDMIKFDSRTREDVIKFPSLPNTLQRNGDNVS